MIAKLKGTIESHTETGIVLDVNGVGYEIVSQRLRSLALGSISTVLTLYHVGSDNIPVLYGFASSVSKNLFQKLLSVQGVGPKTAIRILDSQDENAITNAIENGDVDFFTQVKGLGRKAASKIILELKNKLVIEDSEHHDLYQALETLRFTRKEISLALRNVDIRGLSEKDALTVVLKEMKSQ